jgi:hypothetical protein
MHSLGEHAISSVIMYAILDKYKLTNKSTGKQVAIDEAYDVVKGELVLKEGFEFDDDAKFDIYSRIQDAKRRTQGNYSSTNKTMAQRYAAGSLIEIFRKWIAQGTKRRWRGVKGWDSIINAHKYDDDAFKFYNETTGKYEEGTHYTLLRFLRGYVADVQAFGFDSSQHIYSNWDKMNNEDKANIKRSIYEIAYGLGMIALANMLLGLSSDDDDEFLASMAYLTRSAASEVMFYFNPMESIKLLEQPSAVLKTVKSIVKLGTDFAQHGFTGEYETGRLSGENYFLRNLGNLTPAYRGFFTFDPDFSNQFAFGKNSK